jgi:hypothetical protein
MFGNGCPVINSVDRARSFLATTQRWYCSHGYGCSCCRDCRGRRDWRVLRPRSFELEHPQFYEPCLDCFLFNSINVDYELNVLLCNRFNEHHLKPHELDSDRIVVFERVHQYSVNVLHDIHCFDSASERHHTSAQRLFSHNADFPRHIEWNGFHLHSELQSGVCEFDDVQG